ncbi:MAG: hypothetical protein JO372_23750, partial [Solirubrobacterales bacterium]|nr:hypothetical protein [Solirubrobacterales bacterium]
TGGGSQPGDPAKAAAAILAAIEAEHPPLRLALGDGAIDAIGQRLQALEGELAEWESVGRATSFDSQWPTDAPPP